MSDGRGPWDQPEPDPPPRRAPNRRLWIWLGLLALVGVGLLLLSQAFPGRVRTDEDWFWLVRGLGILVLVSASLLTARQVNWGQKARYAAIWIAIAAVLFVVAAYRGELEGVGQHLKAEFSGSYPVATGARELVVSQDDNGGFFVMGQVNGQPVRFLVDTGASDTVLSPEDAHRLGLDDPGLDYGHAAETANGMGFGARITLDSLSVGAIAVSHLPAVINKAPMSSSLLGMTFLARLESFQVRDRKLYLKARD